MSWLHIMSLAKYRSIQRKIMILATVQKHRKMSASQAVSWSHIRGSAGMRAIDELAGGGCLVKQANGGQGLGYAVTLSEKGADVLRKYREMLGLLET